VLRTGLSTEKWFEKNASNRPIVVKSMRLYAPCALFKIIDLFGAPKGVDAVGGGFMTELI
jgi:hypothetical protein